MHTFDLSSRDFLVEPVLKATARHGEIGARVVHVIPGCRLSGSSTPDEPSSI
jgi:hypothetical protein